MDLIDYLGQGPAHHSTILAACLWALVAVALRTLWETVYLPAQSRSPCWGFGLSRHWTGSEKAVAGCLEVASGELVPSELRQTRPTPLGTKGASEMDGEKMPQGLSEIPPCVLGRIPFTS